ncbi:MAG TPA: ATP-binding protein [Magnetospirillaceae bacterium]|jgi:PAS domain S-box-containing protein
MAFHLNPETKPQVTRFVLIALIFVGVQIAALAVGYTAVAVIDSIRAYASGESFYAKGQKEAVLSLHRYVRTGDEKYYDAFRIAIAAPIGDRLAREALQKSPSYDYTAAFNGFRQGKNDPADLPGLIQLFVWAHYWGPFAKAVDDWVHGDALTAKLSNFGDDLHKMIRGGTLTEAARETTLQQVDLIDDDLTQLEESFSNHMGEAARTATNLVVIGLGVSSILLWSIGVAFAWRTFRRGIEASSRLTASEQRFKHFAEVASDWFWETDQDTRIVYLSERFTPATGARADDFIGRPALDTLKPMAEGETRQQQVADLAARKIFRGWIYRGLLPDGRETYWKVSGTPVYGPSGTFIGYRGTGTDITEEVVNQTILAKAKEQAEAANTAKNEFLANMSHELRTPLNSILGFAQLLGLNAKEPLTQRQSRQISQIERSGSHLLALIEDILDFSKIETGNIKLSLERVQLPPVIEQVRASLQILADEAQIALTIVMPNDLPAVRADRVRLMQVLMNLGSNAIKYNTEGGQVRVIVEAVGLDRVRLSVVDTGPGIAEDRQAELFQPFNRLGAETGPIQGSGIGLSIVKKLVDLMSGTIAVHSAKGTGTTFAVELPAILGSESRLRRNPEAASEKRTRDRIGGFQMLYIEDNPSNIRLMEELIESVGNITLLTAAEPRAGLDLARAHRPDIIVLDINLPGMSGFEVLRAIRAIPSLTGVPVMALSAAAMQRQIEDGLAAGFTHYLTKPIDVAEFLKAINEILANMTAVAWEDSGTGI